MYRRLDDGVDHLDALLLELCVEEEARLRKRNERKRFSKRLRTRERESAEDTHGLVVRGENALLRDLAVEDELDCDTARNTDQASHGRRSTGRRTVGLKGRRERLDLAVGTLDDELVLEHDEVSLSRRIRALLVERLAERVEEVALRVDLLGREETELSELGDDLVAERRRREGLERSELGDDGLLVGLGSDGGGSDLDLQRETRNQGQRRADAQKVGKKGPTQVLGEEPLAT